MDWDGIGAFAMFISTGAIGVGLIVLRAYKAKLAAGLERARIESAASAPDYAQEQIRELEEQVRVLRERVDFNEKLIGGRSRSEVLPDPGPEASPPARS